MPALAALVLLGLPVFPCPEPRPGPAPATAGAPTATAAPTGPGGIPSGAADGGYGGVVRGDAVNVRAGPGTAYEVVTQLEGGARVAVLGEAFGWLLVRPAADLHVYVGADLVEQKGDGIAVVTRDRVNLRARPALDGTVLGQAQHGDLVRMVDSVGDFVAVLAPPDVAFYVHKDLVARADALAGAGGSTAAEGAAIGATGGRGGAAAPFGTPAGEGDAAAPAVTPTAGEKAMRARELYLAELDKADLDAMDFGPAERLFDEAAREATDAPVRALAQAGSRRIRVARELQQDYRRRLGPIERMVGNDREPCDPGKP